MISVSVLLPIYNGERFLTEALQSLSQQTLVEFEVIICDDGSTDSSADIARQFADRDKRFKYVKNEVRQGLFGNYNECLRQAQGTYIKPFAQDDALEPQALERMVRILEDNPEVALVSVARKSPREESGSQAIIRPFPRSRQISANEVIRNNLILMSNWVGEPSVVLYRRKHASTGFDTSLYHYGDLEYWFRILENGDFYYLDEVLSTFRRHEGQATSANLGGLYFAIDLLRLGERYWSYLEDIGETKDNFYRRLMEKVSAQVDHLVRTEGLDAERVRKYVVHDHIDNERTQEELLKVIDDFREIAFHATRSIYALNRELYELSLVKERWYKELSRLELLESQLEDLHNSTSWKVTAPLRMLASTLDLSSGKPEQS